MNKHMDESLLHDFQEGLLGEEAEAEVRGHLEVCPACRNEAESFEDLKAQLGGLPQEAEPSRDLWPQIAWRMDGGRAKGSVPAQEGLEAGGPTASGMSTGNRVSARFSLSGWQLLAASIALVVISGGSVWAFLNGPTGSAPGPAISVPSPAHHVAWDEGYQVFDEAVADLEVILNQGRDVLDPETVRVLEENLTAIDVAIQEAREALDQDPASSVLQRFLSDHLRKKVDLLRQAAGAVNSIT